MLGDAQNRCCFIGDAKIHESVISDVLKRMKVEMTRLNDQGVIHFICAATGWFNYLAASMAVVLKNDDPSITLTFVVPSEDYGAFAPRKEREFFLKIWKEADEIINAAKRYTYKSVQDCERLIIENSQYCVCLAKNQTRAIQAVEYAKNSGRTLIDLTEKSPPFP